MSQPNDRFPVRPLEWLTDADGTPIPGTHNDRDYPRDDGCICNSTDDHHTVECYSTPPAPEAPDDE